MVFIDNTALAAGNTAAPPQIGQAQIVPTPTAIPPTNPEPAVVNAAVPTVVAEFNPPIPMQGGTCIAGSIIDFYEKPITDFYAGHVGPGWSITATSEDEQIRKQVWADANGAFTIGELGAGTWTIELIVPEGWSAYTAAKFNVTLNGDADAGCAAVRFKMQALGCLNVFKRDNATMPIVNAGLPGWQITITDANGAQKFAVTDGTGKAQFKNLEPGTWQISESHKQGWTPANGSPSTVTGVIVSPQTADQACANHVFLNEQVHTSCIIARKQMPDGTIIPSWEIELTRDDGTQMPQRLLTEANGQVTFKDLPLGDWTVREIMQTGFLPVGPPIQKVTLSEPSIPNQCPIVTFTNMPEPLSTCIQGYKINHLDQGLNGWKIIAENAATGQRLETITSHNELNRGHFRFDGITTGEWHLSEEAQPGWTAVTPPSFTVQIGLDELAANQCVQVRFKNRTKYACVDVFKRDASDGAGLPNWPITLKPAFGSEAITMYTDGTGHVRFNRLTPGFYDVTETMQPGWQSVTPETRRIELQATGSCYEDEYGQPVIFENCQIHSTAPQCQMPPNGD